jgi:hypothetical protein
MPSTLSKSQYKTYAVMPMGARIIIPWIKYRNIFFRVRLCDFVAVLLIQSVLPAKGNIKRMAAFYAESSCSLTSVGINFLDKRINLLVETLATK